MKIHILKDKLIKQADLDKVTTDVAGIFTTHSQVTPTYTQEDFDFSFYPKVTDSVGDEHLTNDYLKLVANEVYTKKEDSIDHVILLIHRDNWNMKGIWGTNYSTIYNGYMLQVCRFDNKNLVNSVGTMYHEIMHSVDAMIQTYVGTNVSALLEVPWDKFIVHGGRPDAEGTTKWKYIRNKENTEALDYLGTLLKDAYAKRHQLYDQKYQAKQKELIGVLEKLVILLRQKFNKKSTVNK